MGASLFELISGKNEVIIDILFIININININISALGNEKMVNNCNNLSGGWVPQDVQGPPL